MADPRNTNMNLKIIASANKLIDALNSYILSKLAEIKNNEDNRRDIVLECISTIYAFFDIRFDKTKISKDLADYTKQTKPEKMFLNSVEQLPEFSATQWLGSNVAEKAVALDKKLFIGLHINQKSKLGSDLLQAINAVKDNADIPPLPQEVLIEIAGKLKPTERGTMAQASKGMNTATSAEGIWIEDLKKDFPDAKPTKDATAKQEYARMFKKQNVFYLTPFYGTQKDIVLRLKNDLKNVTDINTINQQPYLGVTEKTPDGFAELPQFKTHTSPGIVYALEINLSKKRFEELLKERKVDEILEHTTGVAKYENNTYTISPAKVIKGKLQITAETETPIAKPK